MKLYQIIEIVALLSGLIVYKTIRPDFLKIIVALLLITVINECLIVPYIKMTGIINRNYAYNIFSLIDISIWFFTFYKIETSSAIKKIIVGAAITCLTYTLLELNFLKSWEQLHPDSFRVYNIMIVAMATRYFYRIMLKEYHNILLDSFFWVSTGCFLFHFIFFVNITMLAEDRFWDEKTSRLIFNFLHNIANILYYNCLSIAFYVCYLNYNRAPKKSPPASSR